MINNIDKKFRILKLMAYIKFSRCHFKHRIKFCDAIKREKHKAEVV